MAPPGLAGTAMAQQPLSLLNQQQRKLNTKKQGNRSYPRGVSLDFRKLAGLTLVNYIDHHGVNVRPEAPPSELASAVARHFEQMEVDEDECIGGFLERLEKGPNEVTDYTRNTMQYPPKALVVSKQRPPSGPKGGSKKDKQTPATHLMIPNRKRTQFAARPGEQVAAKVTRTDENGSWILASVQRFYPDTETYDVQDEDDTSKLIRLPWSHVMRLSTGGEGGFTKGSDCMAIFPETTSFYKAKVAKSPVWKLEHHHMHRENQGSSGGGQHGSNHVIPTVKEVIVKFEDDEDAVTGKTPHRRVPSRYVIPVPAKYFYEEDEDVDLTPPQMTVGSSSGGSGVPVGAVGGGK